MNHSEETKNKIGDKNRGRKWTPEQRIKYIKSKTGLKIKKASEERKEKMRKRFKGIPLSEEHKKKLSIAHKGKFTGEQHHRWKGGYENTLMNNRKRRILKKGNGGSHTLGEWQTLKAQYNYTCPCCKKSEPEIKLTEDHIIPISKGGSNNIENIQPLCYSCNSRKQANIIKY